MWRDFFPNAQIYGLDNLEKTIFQDERITTYLCEETWVEDLKGVVETIGSDIDLFIDDGSHKTSDQIFVAKTLMPLLDKGVIYIIEDVGYVRKIKDALREYDIEVPAIPNLIPLQHPLGVKRDRLIVLRHK